MSAIPEVRFQQIELGPYWGKTERSFFAKIDWDNQLVVQLSEGRNVILKINQYGNNGSPTIQDIYLSHPLYSSIGEHGTVYLINSPTRSARKKLIQALKEDIASYQPLRKIGEIEDV